MAVSNSTKITLNIKKKGKAKKHKNKHDRRESNYRGQGK